MFLPSSAGWAEYTGPLICRQAVALHGAGFRYSLDAFTSYAAFAADYAVRRGAAGSHPGDQLLYPLVDRAEWVLAQYRSLRLVVELQVHPVHGEVAAALLRPPDELTAQAGAGRLRGDGLGLEDVQVTGGAVDGAL